MNGFKETVKLYRVPAKDNAAQIQNEGKATNQQKNKISKYDEVFKNYLERVA